MSKFKADPFPTDTPSSYPTVEMNELFDAILALKNKKEAADFFRDLLTIPEIKEFTNRWQAVKLILRGESYVVIARKLGMSTATVTRVAHWLHNGMGGYKALADRQFRTKFKDSYTSKRLPRTGKYRLIPDV